MVYEELRALLGVVEAGNFTKAATAIGVPRPTLRRRLAALEARVGAEVLVRSQRQATPTAAGEVLLEQARTLIDQVESLVARASAVGEAPLERIGAALPLGVPTRLISSFLRVFRSAFPDITLDLRFYGQPRRDLLDDVDVLFHVGAYGVEGPWFTYHINDVRELLLASPDYLAAHGTPQTLAELDEHSVGLVYFPGEPRDRLPLQTGRHHPLVPILATDDPRVMEGIVLDGVAIGLCAVPDIGLPFDELIPVLPEVVGRTRPFRVMVRKTLAQQPQLRELFRVIRMLVTEVRAPSGGPLSIRPTETGGSAG